MAAGNHGVCIHRLEAAYITALLQTGLVLGFSVFPDHRSVPVCMSAHRSGNETSYQESITSSGEMMMLVEN